MPDARPAGADDLDALLALLRVSEVSAHAEPRERAARIWSDTLSQKNVSVFVSSADAGIVATCMLITAPNLLRAGRQHGFLENVVTHPEYRGQGHGQAVVRAALTEARDCYHVLLQSGRADPRVRRFYEHAALKPVFAWAMPRGVRQVSQQPVLTEFQIKLRFAHGRWVSHASTTRIPSALKASRTVSISSGPTFFSSNSLS
jgi:GNAT superfamily N-acetyltransferase